MTMLGRLLMHFETEDFPIGCTVTTPTGRRAVVVKHLTGASKFDCFSRVMIHYEGGGPKDLATLQPQLLKRADPPRVSVSVQCQLGFAF